MGNSDSKRRKNEVLYSRPVMTSTTSVPPYTDTYVYQPPPTDTYVYQPPATVTYVSSSYPTVHTDHSSTHNTDYSSSHVDCSGGHH